MRKGTDKALAAFACAVLIGALGAMSWHSEAEVGIRGHESGQCGEGAGARDEVIYEIEKLFYQSPNAQMPGTRSPDDK